MAMQCDQSGESMRTGNGYWWCVCGAPEVEDIEQDCETYVEWSDGYLNYAEYQDLHCLREQILAEVAPSAPAGIRSHLDQGGNR